jgi:hypothetical protein
MRDPDWEQALADYLAGKQGCVFAWGTCDCAMFAAGAVEAMTGTDPASDIRGQYKSQASAARAIKRKGFTDLGEWVGSLFSEIGPAFAHRGDIVMSDGNLGICTGGIAWFVGEENGEPGLVSRPMQEWERAWRVPFTG